MFKSFLANFGLLAVFLGLLALPLSSFLILKKPLTSSAVLSATSNAYNGSLTFGREYKPVLLKEVTATAFGSQKATYSDVLWITNNEPVAKTYKINVLRSTAADGVKSLWLFKNSQPLVTLNPGDSSSVSLELTSTNPQAALKIDYLVSIE